MLPRLRMPPSTWRVATHKMMPEPSVVIRPELRLFTLLSNALRCCERITASAKPRKRKLSRSSCAKAWTTGMPVRVC